MRIYIPTIGRVEKQLALEQMPVSLRRYVTIVCPYNEARAHRERWPESEVLGCRERGIVRVRDWIMEHAWSQKRRDIVVTDDDTTVQVRDADMRIRDATPQEVVDGYNWFDTKLHTYAHASWMPRYFGYDTPGDEFEGGKDLSITGFDVERVRKAGATFGKGLKQFAVMEDLNMTLQLLLAGLPNIISLKYRGDHHTRNAPGGCDTWRENAKHTRESALALLKMYPTFGRVRENKKTGGLDFIGYWKKACKEGLRHGA